MCKLSSACGEILVTAFIDELSNKERCKEMVNTNQAKMIKDVLEASIRAANHNMVNGYVEYDDAKAINDLVSVLGNYDSHGDVSLDVRQLLSEMLDSTIHYAHNYTDVTGLCLAPSLSATIKLLIDVVDLIGA